MGAGPENDPTWGINSNSTHDCGSKSDSYLKKIAWSGMRNKWPLAYTLLEKINFDKQMIGEMALYLDINQMEPHDAAKKWIDENEDIWSKWFADSNFNSSILDNFPFPKVPDSTDFENGYKYYPIKEFSQILNIDEGDIPKVFLQVFIYKTINLNTNEESLFFTSFGKIQRQGNISLYSTKSYKNDIEGQSQLIEGIKETLHNRIDRMAFSKNPHHSWVGEIIEVLPNDKVKIKLYDGSRIQSNLLLNATTRYSLTINGYKEWKLNGIKHQIEDIQLGIDYFKNNEPAIPDSLLSEYNELENKLSYYTYMLDSLIENNINKPGHNWSSDKFYIIEVSEVFEKEAIGKLHSKYKPWVEIKVGHKLSIHK